MKLAKSLLLGTVAGFAAVAGAQAADLPSRKAAPASYVKICDAYGAGFFYIPGTDTCLKVGGYVRAEFQYTPGKNGYAVGTGAIAGPGTAIPPAGVFGSTALNYVVPAIGSGPGGIGVPGDPIQVRNSLDTSGSEVRGRIDLDARTPTALGTVRTAVRLRAASTSGIRNTTPTNNGAFGLTQGSVVAITIEQAFIQWAGFTFGVAPENYAFMPSFMYNSNPWAGFPNGMKQIAYTATFGGGISATLAIEDRTDFGSGQVAVFQPQTGYHLVANVRIDQGWGFAVLHGMIGNNSVGSGYSLNATNAVLNGIGSASQPAPLTGFALNTNPLFGVTSKGGYAIGGTAKINLPMIAAGDAVYFTANYTDGLLGSLVGNSSLQNLNTASGRRVAGGIQEILTPLVITNGLGTLANPYTVANVKGWNLAMAATHYWTPQLRSNISAGYVRFNPPTVSGSNLTNNQLFQWGRSSVYEIAASLIYSPAKDFDIGLEVQYLNYRSTIQNLALSTGTFGLNTVVGVPPQTARGLSGNNISTHLRIERQF